MSFLDENGIPRISSNSETINLIDPLAWIFDKLQENTKS
jgi:hypothetical protein